MGESMSALSSTHFVETSPRRRNVTAMIFGALAAAILYVPGAASAQGHKQADETPYQAYLDADCPSGSNFCRFVSDEVPALSRLEILRVACQGWHISTSLPSFVVIAELRTGADVFLERIDFLKTTYEPANGGSVWAISEPTLMFIPAGHKLRISLNSGTTGVGSYGCTI